MKPGHVGVIVKFGKMVMNKPIAMNAVRGHIRETGFAVHVAAD